MTLVKKKWIIPMHWPSVSRKSYGINLELYKTKSSSKTFEVDFTLFVFYKCKHDRTVLSKLEGHRPCIWWSTTKDRMTFYLFSICDGFHLKHFFLMCFGALLNFWINLSLRFYLFWYSEISFLFLREQPGYYPTHLGPFGNT